MGLIEEIQKRNWKEVTLGLIVLTVIGIVVVWGINYLLTKTADDVIAGDTSAKYIAVVMSGSDKTFTIPKEFKQGFGDKSSFKATDRNQTIYIERKEDLYSEEHAKTVADSLVNDEKYVLIIGNSNSQLTEVTLNSILESSNRPGFVLPIATADGLISKARSEKYSAILRMVPDNDNQASTIARFIFKKFEKPNVVILVDQENQAYSKNLSRNVAARVLANSGNVVLNHAYGNSHRLLSLYGDLESRSIRADIIVYVGISSNGMLLIEELKLLGLDIPVIFSDGCTVEDLITRAKSLDSETFFLSAVTKSDQGLEPTYEPIGKDAWTLANKIMNGIEGEITRASVREFIETQKNRLSTGQGFAGGYEFTEDGNNKAMNFKVYTHNDGVLTQVRGLE